MKPRVLFLVLILMGLAASGVSAATADSAISVEGGKIRGAPTDVQGVTVFKAVPFAAPPVGPNRWKAPQPIVPWSGVRESTTAEGRNALFHDYEMKFYGVDQ